MYQFSPFVISSFPLRSSACPGWFLTQKLSFHQEFTIKREAKEKGLVYIIITCNQNYLLITPPLLLPFCPETEGGRGEQREGGAVREGRRGGKGRSG